jgi:arginyl-tRNA synthetase
LADTKEVKFPQYKGLPLVRSGNTLYYGNMFDPYVVMLQIMSTTEKDGIKMADKVSVQLLSTDPDIPITDKVIKKSEKPGLYAAMDIASIWLTRALKAEETK